MNRRQLLAAIGGVGLTGGSLVALHRTGLSGTSSAFPIRIDTVDATGSEAGTTQVPTPGTPTLIDLFATWCAPCEEQMNALSSVYAEYADRVTFISVTNQQLGGTFTADDLRAWWRRHHGEWMVGVDPGSELMAALGAGGVPYHAIADASGVIQWQQPGLSPADTLRNHLDRVLATP
jgi:thiol-disulfide isomerase/thioredoxin